MKSGNRFIDITGQLFGRYLVLEFDGIKNGNAYWKCQCSCSNKTIRSVCGSSLRSGDSKSCGCLQKEFAQSNTGKNNSRWKGGRSAVSKRFKINGFDKWIDMLKDMGLTSCAKCGYNKCFAAIDFHHIHPNTKTCSIGDLFRRAFNEKNKRILLKELKKCTPLCANCHRELHFGEITI